MSVACMPIDHPGPGLRIMKPDPPTPQEVLGAIAKLRVLMSTAREVAARLGVHESAIDPALITLFDAGLIEVWENSEFGNCLCLTPLALETLGLEVYEKYEGSFMYARRGLADRLARRAEKEGHRSAGDYEDDDEVSSFTGAHVWDRSPSPSAAVEFDEEASLAAEILEAEIEAELADPTPRSPLVRALILDSHERRRHSLAGFAICFVGDAKTWPVAPTKDGRCGCCAGARRGPNRTCLHCSDRETHPVNPVKLPEWSGAAYGSEEKQNLARRAVRHSKGKRR